MDEKKKIAILAGLFVVVIGVGAFQFAKSGNPDATTPTETATKTEVAADTVPKTGPDSPETDDIAPGTEVDPALIAAARLNPRDPFDGTSWDGNLKPPTPVTPQKPAPVRNPRPPRGMGGSDFRPLPIGEGVLPQPEGSSTPIAGGKFPSIEDFPYTIAGTMVGDRPCVLLTDSAGKQKLVGVGGAIDGDSKVVSISKGVVVVNHRGKPKSFRVGGMNPSKNSNEDKP